MKVGDVVDEWAEKGIGPMERWVCWTGEAGLVHGFVNVCMRLVGLVRSRRS